MRNKRGIVGAALVLALGGMLSLPLQAGAEAHEPHVVGIDPASLDQPDALRKAYSSQGDGKVRSFDLTSQARCGDPAPDPVPDGQPIVVLMAPAPPFTVGSIPAASWRTPPATDPTWLLNYQGLMWMKPLARRAAKDKQSKSLDALVQQVTAFHRQNPDPKNNNYGWDEGTALRRLETENCLYTLTQSAALIPGMTADVGVLTGNRYYGPPYRPVHNHGMMANLQMIRAGQILDRPAWVQTAINRIVAEAPLAFSKNGVSYEQSSMYQLGNATLWEQAAVELEATPGYAAAAAKIRKTVSDAYRVYNFMTEPDGKIVQIGDSDEIPGRPADLGANRAIRDDQSGWVIGRWGWTDPDVPYYTVRYGPIRRAHGHDDRAGGVTWSIKGTRVLVGPGRYSYDTNDPYSRYQTRPDAQNVAIPAGGTVKGGTSTVTTTFNPTSHIIQVRDTVYGPAHTRGVTVNSDLPRMVVSDKFTGVAKWRQQWHLDPDWTLVSGAVGGTTLVFQHPSGHILSITTTGVVVSVLKGSTAAAGPYGWHFPRFQTKEPAYQIMIDNNGANCTTTFRVS
jgi:hypothetical protein